MAKENNKVDVMFLMRESCTLCQEVLTNLTSYMKNKVNIDFRIVDLENDNNYSKKNCAITPAIWVNDKMWYAGSVNIERFDKKINELTSLQ